MNTFFYTTILWLLFAAAGFVCRLVILVRERRGHCLGCAYPVGTSDVCTECGKPIPNR